MKISRTTSTLLEEVGIRLENTSLRILSLGRLLPMNCDDHHRMCSEYQTLETASSRGRGQVDPDEGASDGELKANPEAPNRFVENLWLRPWPKCFP